MKITKMKHGFDKLGDDDYRVEAPMHEPNENVLEDFTLPNGREAQRYVQVKKGKKLRSHAGRDDEIEPTVWHIYKMTKFVREFTGRDHSRYTVEKTSLEILDDDFHGTAKEAIAVCETHKAGG